MQTERNYKMYIDDMHLAMSRIAEYIIDYDFITFKRDYKTVDAVIRNFEIIGEASKNIPEFIKKEYSEIPWNEMYALRNRVSHEYFGIDYEIIWEIITNHLPINKLVLEQIIESLNEI